MAFKTNVETTSAYLNRAVKPLLRIAKFKNGGGF